MPKIPEPVADDGRLALSTRRGKQFNSMVQQARDPLTGAGREAVLISAADAERLGIADGGAVMVRSDFGELAGTALVVPIAAGNVQVHWPEANVLIERDRLLARGADPRLQRPGQRGAGVAPERRLIEIEKRPLVSPSNRSASARSSGVLTLKKIRSGSPNRATRSSGITKGSSAATASRIAAPASSDSCS